MRKIVMTVLAGGSLLCSSMVAEAGVLTGIRTVGNGLNAKVEVAADSSLTYVFFRKDATHWVIDLAKTEPGSVDPAIELGLPAATNLTAEKRQVGNLAITRLTVAVRPGVSMAVKPSPDRKMLNLSFQSGMAPASAKEDDLLGDLDAPAKPGKPAAKEDLDSLLDTPVAAPAPAPTATALGGKDDLASLDDLDKPVAKPASAAPVAAAKPVIDKELDDLVKPESEEPGKRPKMLDAALDKEITGVESPAVPPAKPVLEPVVPEKPGIEEPKHPVQKSEHVSEETKSPALKLEQAKAIAAVAAAAPAPLPAGADLGALTPDELGIASPELEAATPAAKVETKAEPVPVKVVAPIVEEKPAVTAPVAVEKPLVATPAIEEKALEPAVAEPVKPTKLSADRKAAGSLKVEDGTVEILVDNFSTYKAFTLMEPTRFVIDFNGAKASLKAAAAKARLPGVNAVRFSQYPDKVRIVFDLPKGDLPAYKVEKLDSGVRVVFK